MPNPQTVETFMATVEAGDYVGAIERFYTPDASMRENMAPTRIGRDALAEHERGVMAQFGKITARRRGPPMISPDGVAIRWRFEFHMRQGGSRSLEEVAWQIWRGDAIAEETFFYDPAQMAVEMTANDVREG
jgi:hypothetical protein